LDTFTVYGVEAARLEPRVRVTVAPDTDAEDTGIVDEGLDVGYTL
jgi:hypothetical protein